MSGKPASIPKNSPPASPDERADSFAFGATIAAAALGAILLVVVGRDTPPIKAASTPAAEASLPEPIEPAGILESAPTRFVWKPSREDVDLSQVIIFRGDVSRIWESAPTESSEVTIPLHAFDVIYPMEPCFWRVREVADGKPVAASKLEAFKVKNPPQPLPQEGMSGG